MSEVVKKNAVRPSNRILPLALRCRFSDNRLVCFVQLLHPAEHSILTVRSDHPTGAAVPRQHHEHRL